MEKFKETGVLPVSGKYTDSGKMTTKNVKLSDLVGGGGGSGLSLVTVAAVYNNNDITITVPSNNTFVRVTGIDVTSDYGKGPSTVHIVVPSTGAGEYLTSAKH